MLSASHSAMASLESSRVEASRNQRYLAIYSQPNLPEHPIYPKRITYSLLLFLGLNVLWGILVLILFSFFDQMRAGWIGKFTQTELLSPKILQLTLIKLLGNLLQT